MYANHTKRSLQQWSSAPHPLQGKYFVSGLAPWKFVRVRDGNMKKHPQTHGVAMGRKKMAVFLVKTIMAEVETRERKRYIDDVFSPSDSIKWVFIDQQANTLHPLINSQPKYQGLNEKTAARIKEIGTKESIRDI